MIELDVEKCFYKLNINSKVVVRCVTYNQSKYIEATLSGFEKQKTNFKYTCVIIDDCSGDDQKEIIKTYANNKCFICIDKCFDNDMANVVVATSKINGNCEFVFVLLKENTYAFPSLRNKMFELFRSNAKYEAICEGDDYWVDIYKLQKQVNFMDEHNEYGLVHTAFKTIPEGMCKSNNLENKNDIYIKELLSHNYRIATLTVMCRVEIYNSIPKYFSTNAFGMGDYPLWIEFASVARIKFMRDITGVYRILHESASHSKDEYKEIEFLKKCWSCAEFYAKKLNVNIDLNYEKYFYSCMKVAANHGNKHMAKNILRKAIKENKITVKLLLLYMCTQSKTLFNIVKSIYYR